jgi:hypothetical protein
MDVGTCFKRPWQKCLLWIKCKAHGTQKPR